MFDVTDHPENQRSAILLDLYFNALAYANKEDMTMEKTSCILAILQAVHEKAGDERMTIDKAFDYFKLLALQTACIALRTAAACSVRRDERCD